MNYLDNIKFMSKDNKYTKWYLSIMCRALARSTSKKHAIGILEYAEAHHIVPKSINPDSTKDKNNIVYLSGREHFVAHLLLVRMLVSKEHQFLMAAALNAMTWGKSKRRCSERYRPTSWEFDIARRISSLAFSEREKRPVIVNEAHYDSVSAAARAYDVSSALVVLRCKQTNTRWHEWRYADEPEKEFKPKFVKSVIIDGVKYDSVESVKRHFKITRFEADARLQDTNWPNWQYVEESSRSYSRITRKSKQKPVIVNGKYYESIYVCSKELDIDKSTLRYRINNSHRSKFMDYQWALVKDEE